MKRFTVAFMSVFFLMLSLHAGEMDPIFGVNPDNPFDLHPPIWVQGFWEDDVGDDHMHISPNSISTDFMVWTDGGAELTLSLIERLCCSSAIYKPVFDHYDPDSRDNIYKTELIKALNFPDYAYRLFKYEPRVLSFAMLVPFVQDLFDSIGIGADDEAVEVISKIDDAIREGESAAVEIGDSPDSSRYLQELEQALSYLVKLRESIVTDGYSYEDFLQTGVPNHPFTLMLEDLIGRIDAVEVASYPYYSVEFLLDGTVFAAVEFTRSEDNLDFSLELFCYPEYLLGIMPDAPLIADDDLVLYGLRKEAEFEFREYSADKRATKDPHRYY